jgi:hypothetical protein
MAPAHPPHLGAHPMDLYTSRTQRGGFGSAKAALTAFSVMKLHEHTIIVCPQCAIRPNSTVNANYAFNLASRIFPAVWSSQGVNVGFGPVNE